MKQNTHAPQSVAEMGLLLSPRRATAVEVEKVADFEAALLSYARRAWCADGYHDDGNWNDDRKGV